MNLNGTGPLIYFTTFLCQWSGSLPSPSALLPFSSLFSIFLSSSSFPFLSLHATPPLPRLLLLQIPVHGISKPVENKLSGVCWCFERTMNSDSYWLSAAHSSLLSYNPPSSFVTSLPLCLLSYVVSLYWDVLVWIRSPPTRRGLKSWPSQFIISPERL